MARIAFLGTGLIGSAMVEAALIRGEEVVVWNRDPAKAAALVKLGARTATDPGAAAGGAGVERIHLALSDDDAVDAVLDAAVARAAPGTLVIDHSTTLPARTRARAEKHAAVELLHAPIFMSPQMCREAGGLMLAAGPEARFKKAEPALAAMTRKLWWLGARPDLAAAYKLFGNAMILTITAGLADVFQMGSALGIAPEDAYRLFGEFKAASTIDIRGARMSKGDFAATFALSMARKDLRLMLESAGGAPLAVLPALAERMDVLIQRGLGDRDLGALAADALRAYKPA